MWNSGIDRRKSKGFVEIQMENKRGTSMTPNPQASTETQADSQNGSSTASGEGFPEALGNKEFGPSDRLESHFSRPNEFGSLPTYATSNFSKMPTNVSGPVHGPEDQQTMPREFSELATNGPGCYSTVPTGYAELSTNDWQGYSSVPSEAAKPQMSDARRAVR